MEKIGFWNHIDKYFLNLAAKDEEAESWTLESLKHKKNQVQPTPHIGSVTVPECIEMHSGKTLSQYICIFCLKDPISNNFCHYL